MNFIVDHDNIKNMQKLYCRKLKHQEDGFSLILKLNHMLYKHDIENRSNTICWKIWFYISYKTHNGSNKHGSTSIMRDNM